MMRRCSFTAHAVEIARSPDGAARLLKSSGVRLAIDGPTVGVVEKCLIADIAWADVRLFLAGTAVSCFARFHPGVVHFGSESGFVRLRLEDESTSAFLSSELNLEMQRMLLEMIE